MFNAGATQGCATCTDGRDQWAAGLMGGDHTHRTPITGKYGPKEREVSLLFNGGSQRYHFYCMFNGTQQIQYLFGTTFANKICPVQQGIAIAQTGCTVPTSVHDISIGI